MKPRVAVITTIVSVLTMLIMITGAFGGGLILAPYINDNAQAAPQLQVDNGGGDPLAAFEQALMNVYEQNVDSVVYIDVVNEVDPARSGQFQLPFGDMFPEDELPEQMPRMNRGQGSGFVWDTDGHIVTNYHVVANAAKVQVTFADGDSVEAEVLGVDPDADLAVIKVELPASELQPLALGDSDALKVGQLTIAIGNPFGQEFTMTSGIVSAVGRTIRSGNSGFSIPEVIQTDASINPGNSGGPLLDRQGRVIGINTQIMSRSGVNSGVGFAVPINTAKRVVPTLITGEDYQYAWLGISGMDLMPEVIDFMSLPSDMHGALVLDVVPNGPADEANLHGSDKTLDVDGQAFQLGGDVITAIEGQPISGMDDLITYLVEETAPGDTVTLEVLHENGETEDVEVTLGVRPDASELLADDDDDDDGDEE